VSGFSSRLDAEPVSGISPMKLLFLPIATTMICGLAVAQSNPVPASSATILGNDAVLQTLGALSQSARQTQLDLSRMKIEKWKAEGSVKRQAQDNSDSLQKNLRAALPGLIQQVQATPNGVGPAFKLYRNLNVVFDVLASVTESAGAFGSKDDYQALATDVANLDDLRRRLADGLEQMTSAKDAAYSQLASQMQAQQKAAAAVPPKKVIVDDTEPPKAPKKKKATAASTPK